MQIARQTYIKIYDGNSSWNELLVRVDHSTQYIASSANEMYVSFSTNNKIRTGFFAEIHQTLAQDRDPLATFCTESNPCKANEGHCYHVRQCQKGLQCGRKNCPAALGYDNDTNCCYELCNDWLDLKNGVLISVGYTNNHGYHRNTECSWTINAAHQNQSVRLHFEDFKVSIIRTRVLFLFCQATSSFKNDK